MRIFHLADLHIGKNVNGFSMVEDQSHVLDQILEYADEYRPDAVVIAGDVYDRQTPGIEGIKLFDSFLTSLTDKNIAVLIISGNHDSPERLSFGSNIMSGRGVYIYGSLAGNLQKIILKDSFGSVNFYLMPFLKPAFVRHFFSGASIETYNDAILMVLNNENINIDERNILIAHQFVVSGNAEPETSESEIGPVGGIDYVNGESMLAFDYVALGHLHGPQKIGCEHMRYAGSPLKYSFSEQNHKKSLCMVDFFEKGLKPQIQLLPLKPLRDMKVIKGKFSELIKAGTDVSPDRFDYLHIILTDESEIIDPVGKLRIVYPNIMALSFDNARTKATYSLSMEEDFSFIDPIELFGDFYFKQNGFYMNESQKELVENLLQAVEQPED